MSAEFACYSYGFHVRNRWKAQLLRSNVFYLLAGLNLLSS